MKVKILSDVRVSPPAGGGRSLACAFPASCRLSNGDILCGYRRGREKHSRDGVFVIQRSTDAGRTWSEPATVFDGMSLAVPESAHCGAVSEANDGTLLAMLTAVPTERADAYIFSETGRQLEQIFHLSRSHDHGRTWSPPQPQTLPHTPPLRYINSRPLALPDGDLLVPLEVTTAAKQQAVMVGRYSCANGTFGDFGFGADDSTGQYSFGDPKLTLLPDGRVRLGLWTFRNATEETVSVHVCDSGDGGRTWRKPRPIVLCCQNFAPLLLSDGRMIVAGNIRLPPEGIRLWCSPDAGETWEVRAPVRMWDARMSRMIGETMTEADLSAQPPGHGKLWESLPRFTFGTPDLVRADDGAVLLTYYAEFEGLAQVRACRFVLD